MKAKLSCEQKLSDEVEGVLEDVGIGYKVLRNCGGPGITTFECPEDPSWFLKMEGLKVTKTKDGEKWVS